MINNEKYEQPETVEIQQPKVLDQDSSENKDTKTIEAKYMIDLQPIAEEIKQQILEIVKLICNFRLELTSLNIMSALRFDAIIIGVNQKLAFNIIEFCGYANFVTDAKTMEQLLNLHGFVASPSYQAQYEKPEKILADMINFIVNILVRNEKFPHFTSSFSGYIITRCQKPSLINSICEQTYELTRGNKPISQLYMPAWSTGIFAQYSPSTQAKDKTLTDFLKSELLSFN